MSSFFLVMKPEPRLHDNIVEALNPYKESWIFLQYLTKDDDPCIYVGKLEMITTGEVLWEDGDPSLWKRIFHRDKLKGSFGYELDLYFKDGIRHGMVGFGELSNKRLARVIKQGGGVIYEDNEAMVEWNIRSGMVSVLYPAEEILRNFGGR